MTEYFDFHHHSFTSDFGIYNLKFNEALPSGYFSAGIHPDLMSENFDEKFTWLTEISRHKNCVAIGECGLDARYDNVGLQMEGFEKQIRLANNLKKPLIIHCVKSFPTVIEMTRKAKIPTIMHGFNKRKTIGDELLNRQFMLSFGKSLLYNVNLQTFFKEMPPDKFFIETDSADVNIEELYLKVAELKEITVEELNLQITENLKLINFPLKNG